MQHAPDLRALPLLGGSIMWIIIAILCCFIAIAILSRASADVGERWTKGETITAEKLERMRSRAINEFTASGIGVRVVRAGNAVALMREDRGHPIGSQVKFKRSTNCTGYGIYNGKMARLADVEALPTGETALTSNMLASYPDDDDAIYCNTYEIGKATHALGATDENLEFWGEYLGINENGKHVIEGPGVQAKPCPPNSTP